MAREASQPANGVVLFIPIFPLRFGNRKILILIKAYNWNEKVQNIAACTPSLSCTMTRLQAPLENVAHSISG